MVTAFNSSSVIGNGFLLVGTNFGKLILLDLEGSRTLEVIRIKRSKELYQLESMAGAHLSPLSLLPFNWPLGWEAGEGGGGVWPGKTTSQTLHCLQTPLTLSPHLETKKEET